MRPYPLCFLSSPASHFLLSTATSGLSLPRAISLPPLVHSTNLSLLLYFMFSLRYRIAWCLLARGIHPSLFRQCLSAIPFSGSLTGFAPFLFLFSSQPPILLVNALPSTRYPFQLSSAPAGTSFSHGLTLDHISSGASLDGIRVTNPNGDCITISNVSKLRIVNSTIGPCAGHGIYIRSSSSVSVLRSSIHDTRNNGISIGRGRDINIHGNSIQGSASAIYAHQSSSVVVEGNLLSRVLGPWPRGQFIQFDKVSGIGNLISCNTMLSPIGTSLVEDAVNIYQSSGLPGHPLLIVNNRVSGGGPSVKGGGIMLGDGGQSHDILAKDNILVSPGQYGIAIAGGSRI